MNAETVADIFSGLERAGIRIWVDGGWCVDALLGRQTRPHSDLDIALAASDAPALRLWLSGRGFAPRLDPASPDWNFVCEAAGGDRIDVHAFVMDGQGDCFLGPPELGQVYPAGSLLGEGRIAGVAVRCVTAPCMIRFKTSFEQREIDRTDVQALRAHLGLS